MKPYLIGIAGCSGSGKTYLARHLEERLGGAHFSLDAYYKDLTHLPFAERTRFNFDDPAMIDSELLIAQLRELSAGRAVERPLYDFVEYTRVAGRTERMEPREFVVVEGLWALYWREVRELCSTRVFVDTPDATCYSRREERDCRERGRTPESVLAQYTEAVRPMAVEYVLPTREYAGVTVCGTDPVHQSVQKIVEHVNVKRQALV